MSTKITRVHARQIIDSRGNPTVEADVYVGTEARGRAAVPRGASTGGHEGLGLPAREKSRYFGKGVRKGVGNGNGETAKTGGGLDRAGETRLGKRVNGLVAL